MYEIQRFEKIERRKPSRIKKTLKVILFFMLTLFTLNVLIGSYLGKSSKTPNLFISPIASVKQVIQKTTSIIKSQENSKELELIINNILVNDRKNYSIVIKNLKTGERYYYNENKIYDSASLYKLWVMGEAYNLIENGKLDKSEVLSANVSDLNEKFNISSESAELTEGEVSRSVSNALENMIKISDNYSALLLSSRIKISNVAKFLITNQLLESKVGTAEDNPKTSAKDVALFFEKLYNGEFANEQYTNEMLTLLKKQQINTKLSKYLPKNIDVAHKTGELGKISHDSGIVYLDKGNYIIVALSETEAPLVANENIANISKEVYSYFTK